MRAQAMSGGRQGYTATAWRGGHPNWNGHYYYHNGGYFYDASFGYPAIMTNEWSNIALLFGGIAVAGALTDDPRLFFAGSVGAFYALGSFNADQYGNGTARMRWAYFNRPYFWRAGVRFDRVSVNVGGHAGYEFRRG